MYKILKTASLTLLLIIFTLNLNVLAFHKGGKSEDIENIEGLKKRDIQIKYCTSNVKIFTKEDEIKIDENKTVEEQLEQFEKNKKKTKTKKEYFKIKSYHSTKATQYEGLKYLTVLKDLKKIDASTPLLEILKFWCVQSIPEDGSQKVFKLNEKTKKLYNEIAIDNGLEKASDPIGEAILESNMIILQRDNLIYSEADFILVENKKRKKIAEKKSRSR